MRRPPLAWLLLTSSLPHIHLHFTCLERSARAAKHIHFLERAKKWAAPPKTFATGERFQKLAHLNLGRQLAAKFGRSGESERERERRNGHNLPLFQSLLPELYSLFLSIQFQACWPFQEPLVESVARN